MIVKGKVSSNLWDRITDALNGCTAIFYLLLTPQLLRKSWGEGFLKSSCLRAHSSQNIGKKNWIKHNLRKQQAKKLQDWRELFYKCEFLIRIWCFQPIWTRCPSSRLKCLKKRLLDDSGLEWFFMMKWICVQYIENESWNLYFQS